MNWQRYLRDDSDGKAQSWVLTTSTTGVGRMEIDENWGVTNLSKKKELTIDRPHDIRPEEPRKAEKPLRLEKE